MTGDDASDGGRDSTETPRTLRGWVTSIRRTLVGPIGILNEQFARLGPFVRSVVGGAIAAGIGLLVPEAVTGAGETVARVPRLTTNELLAVVIGELASGIVVVARGFNRVERTVSAEMGSERHSPDGGTYRRPKLSGGGAIGGLIIGGVIGSSYGPSWWIAGAIFGAVLGDTPEEISARP